MEPAQTVYVDRAVVRPDTLNQVGDTGRPLDAKDGLVDQIEYVAHFPRSSSVASGAPRAQFARIREVGKLFNPVWSGLGGIREHMAQCRDVTVNRLTRDRIVRKGDGHGG